ncbi:MAG: Serine/threonine-protein kinase PknL, partial [Planctomycetota bacterium]
MSDDTLKNLYRWFDRLVDMDPIEQDRQVALLQAAGDPVAVQLEGLLANHRRDEPTENPFTIREILEACERPEPFRLASDLRQLATRLKWDNRRRAFRLQNFLLRKCLSVNTLGATYLAHDERLDREVVALLTFPRHLNNANVRQTILDSSRAVAKIFHPNVATILGIIDIDDLSVVLRQWIPGESLSSWVKNGKDISLPEILALAEGMASGLAAIHSEGVLHGDLKPSNIILRAYQPHPVITDFGTATWLHSDQTTSWHGGTPGFIAPEILAGAAPSARSDLYSLGVVLHWLAVGRLPATVAGRHPSCLREFSEAGLEQQPRGNELAALASIVDELLATDPIHRLDNANALVHKLEKLNQSSVALDQGETVRTAGGRPAFTTILNSRRTWMVHSLGLAGSFAASAMIGASASHTVHATLNETNQFVPGTPPDQTVLLSREMPASAAQEPQTSEVYIFSQVTQDETPHLLFSPKAPGEWISILCEPYRVPRQKILANVIETLIYFNTHPGAATVLFEMQMEAERSWRRLRRVVNRFGGQYKSPMTVIVPNSLLRHDSEDRFRFRLRHDSKTQVNKNLPAVAVASYRADHTKNPQRILQFAVWWEKSADAG